MNKYLVTQMPKPKYRGAMVTVAMIVEAKSAAHAIRLAVEYGKEGNENWFGNTTDCCKPKAELLELNKVFRL